MWAMWAGECMDDRCREQATVWVTTQLRWNSAVAVWTWCDGHWVARTRFFVAAGFYYLAIEAAGTFQPVLPLD